LTHLLSLTSCLLRFIVHQSAILLTDQNPQSWLKSSWLFWCHTNDDRSSVSFMIGWRGKMSRAKCRNFASRARHS
jgi:hypothetical protein